jgi:hypothetical protein
MAVGLRHPTYELRTEADRFKRRDSTSAILVDAEIKKTDSPGGLRAPDGARVMIQRGSDPDAQVRRILDALKVTPERFLDFHQGVVVRDAVFTVADKINPDLIRPSKIPRPFKCGELISTPSTRPCARRSILSR